MRIYYFLIALFLLMSMLMGAWYFSAEKNDTTLRELSLKHIEVLEIVKMINDDVPLSTIVERSNGFLYPVPEQFTLRINKMMKENGKKESILELNEELYNEVRQSKEYQDGKNESGYALCLNKLIYDNYILKQIDEGVPIENIVSEMQPSLRKNALELYDITKLRDIEFTLGINNYAFLACVGSLLLKEKILIQNDLETDSKLLSPEFLNWEL